MQYPNQEILQRNEIVIAMWPLISTGSEYAFYTGYQVLSMETDRKEISFSIAWRKMAYLVALGNNCGHMRCEYIKFWHPR
mmetsp:Transcript_46056/g.55855  ORF Transcript_46056/g.55855 Transcript_46056/m.55855 type:complete len:80 (+) Transcript_46056:52-291(+)